MQATLTSEVNNLKLELVLLKDNVVRILIDEAGTPLRPRFQPLIALNGTPVHDRFVKHRGTFLHQLILESRQLSQIQNLLHLLRPRDSKLF